MAGARDLQGTSESEQSRGRRGIGIGAGLSSNLHSHHVFTGTTLIQDCIDAAGVCKLPESDGAGLKAIATPDQIRLWTAGRLGAKSFTDAIIIGGKLLVNDAKPDLAQSHALCNVLFPCVNQVRNGRKCYIQWRPIGRPRCQMSVVNVISSARLGTRSCESIHV